MLRFSGISEDFASFEAKPEINLAAEAVAEALEDSGYSCRIWIKGENVRVYVTQGKKGCCHVELKDGAVSDVVGIRQVGTVRRIAESALEVAP